MKEKTMADMIAGRRKALAEKMHNTDKAVSKWNRGLACLGIRQLKEA